RMFRISVMTPDQAALLKAELATLAGVVEATVLGEEGVAMLKVSLKGWDEDGARLILQTAD
ncbi:MAG: MFS transporter, partial [Thiobacillus sp.]